MSLMHSAKTVLKQAFYRGLAGGVYKVRAALPRKKNHVLFLEKSADKPTNSFALMMPALHDKGYVCDFFSWGKNRVAPLELLARSLKLAWLAGSVDVVFQNDSCVVTGCLPLKKDTQLVQLWHGCGAFKKFGMSTAEKIFGGSREERQSLPEYANTTLVTVSSPEVSWAYVEAMDLGNTPDVVQPLGVSRTDAFFDEATKASWKEQAYAVVPGIWGKKVLLWAPTFRGESATAEAPTTLDLEALHVALGDDWAVLVKHHPFVRRRPAVPASCEGFAFDVSDTLGIESAMIVSTALVTDYSSLAFEWSLLDRPVAFLAPDRDEYDDWRGFYYDYDELAPGPVLMSTQELAAWVASLPASFDRERLAAFRTKFMASCDGNATERIINAVLGDGADVA